MKRLKTPTIAFTGGGTGGHVFPAFGVIDRLRSMPEFRDSRMFWIGSNTGIEKTIVEARGMEYHGLPAGKLRRYFSLRNLTDLFKVAAGMLGAVFLLIRHRPAVLFSKGGFVSVPPVFAAGLLRIPVISHESDFDPGLATRLNLRITSVQCIPFAESRKFYPASRRVEVTGNPVREDVLRGDPAAGRALGGFPQDMPVLLVMGGSQGARQINEVIFRHGARLLSEMCIIHQTGADGDAAAGDFAAGLPGELAGRYVHQAFFSVEYPDVLASADVVLTRSGAGSMWESGIMSKPAIFMPLVAGARGDQARNAAYAQAAGAAIVIDGSMTGGTDGVKSNVESGEESPEQLILSLIRDKDRLRSMAASWKSLINTDAAEKIAGIIAEFIGGMNHDSSEGDAS